MEVWHILSVSRRNKPDYGAENLLSAECVFFSQIYFFLIIPPGILSVCQGRAFCHA